jgi:LPS export ABC transporter protein LptC
MSGVRTLWILLLVGFLQACVNDMAKVNRIASDKEASSEVVKNVFTTYSVKGHLRAKMRSPELVVTTMSKPGKEMPAGLEVQFYDDSLRENGKLSAKYGFNDELHNTITVRKNVVVVNVKGEQLETEELNWDMNKHILYTDKFVKITTDGEQLFGEGMEAQEDFTNYKIKKLRGTVKVKN